MYSILIQPSKNYSYFHRQMVAFGTSKPDLLSRTLSGQPDEFINLFVVTILKEINSIVMLKSLSCYSSHYKKVSHTLVRCVIYFGLSFLKVELHVLCFTVIINNMKRKQSLFHNDDSRMIGSYLGIYLTIIKWNNLCSSLFFRGDT